ncbi:hypothetical protein Peur_066001 [Populus x canadensis]
MPTINFPPATTRLSSVRVASTANLSTYTHRRFCGSYKPSRLSSLSLAPQFQTVGPNVALEIANIMNLGP